MNVVDENMKIGVFFNDFDIQHFMSTDRTQHTLEFNTIYTKFCTAFDANICT